MVGVNEEEAEDLAQAHLVGGLVLHVAHLVLQMVPKHQTPPHRRVRLPRIHPPPVNCTF
jgi:hypothetical protein